ncbi:MAG: RsmD family RNA methyltransferase, partial [Gemmatimonadales bacterium]
MRIVAGRWAGRELVSPGRRVRPSAEAVRAAALDWVADVLPGARVLDLFAGTGALGLEALSRGAATADFVERNPAALHALKANVARFRLKGRARIFKKDALAFLAGIPPGTYDLALVDPPYTSSLSERVVDEWLVRPFSRALLVECGKDRTLPGRHQRRVLQDT